MDGTLPGNFPSVDRRLLGNCPANAPDSPADKFRKCRRRSGGHPGGWQSVLRRHCRRKSAGESADAESFASEGVRLPMLKGGRLRLKLGKSFCAMIALSPAPVRIKSGSNEW